MTEQIVQQLDIEQLKKGRIHRFWLKVVSDSFGQPTQVPIMIARGAEDGPVLGLTAALHGNEVNGIPLIQQLFKDLDVGRMKGTIIAVPVVNLPSFLRKRRRFTDNVDLNHIMPGKKKGSTSQVYAYSFFEKIVRKFDYLIDLHTASFGRINSYYIRADMDKEWSSKMATMQNPQIILHNPASDGTLRGAAEAAGIPAITLELGNPNVFQPTIISQSLTGVYNVLSLLNMLEKPIISALYPTVLCRGSKWLYTRRGGILYVHPKVTERVEKGDLIAHQENIFGDVIEQYRATRSGVVIGKSVSPVNPTGGRILHLGQVEKVIEPRL